MTTDFENPYSPTAISELPPAMSPDGRRSMTPGRIMLSLFIWTLVCTLSATPSFLIAISEIARDQALAMIIGVIIFIGIYTAADLYTYSSKLRSSRRMRIILRSTFILRSLMVVLYPVAVFTDIMLGMVSVSITQWVFRLHDPAASQPQLGFITTLATTLLQGTLLSVLLLLMGSLIAGLIAAASFLFGARKKP